MAIKGGGAGRLPGGPEGRGPDPWDGPSPRRPALTERAGAAVLAALAATLPFLAAGTARWPGGWIWLTTLAIGLLAHRAHVAARAPALLARRERIGAETPAWDLAWVAVYWPLMLAVPVVAGLTAVRWARPGLPAWTTAPGLGLLAAGLALSARAMVANPWFEGTARLQPGQMVAEGGPYRRIRHPGYAGLLLWALSGPLVLRAPAALAPAALAAAWVVVRTALEDRMLRRGLAGYAAYAARVRWRLLPGIW